MHEYAFSLPSSEVLLYYSYLLHSLRPPLNTQATVNPQKLCDNFYLQVLTRSIEATVKPLHKINGGNTVQSYITPLQTTTQTCQLSKLP